MGEDLPAWARDAGTITLEVSTLTLGEAGAAERASGLELTQILESKSLTRVLAVYVHALRSSEHAPSWQEVCNLRLVDVSRSRSQGRSGGISQASKV